MAPGLKKKKICDLSAIYKLTTYITTSLNTNVIIIWLNLGI